MHVAYVHTPTFISVHMILDMCMLTHTHFFPMIFMFSNFSGTYDFMLFKNLLLYI